MSDKLYPDKIPYVVHEDQMVRQEAVAGMPEETAWADMPAEDLTMTDPMVMGHMVVAHMVVVDRIMAVHMTMG